jgi:hypothetical protein
MYKTKVVTQDVAYECCDLCGEELAGKSSTCYRTSEYIAHYECVDGLVEKNVLEAARQALAEKKAQVVQVQSYVGHVPEDN